MFVVKSVSLRVSLIVSLIKPANRKKYTAMASYLYLRTILKLVGQIPLEA